MAYYVIFDVTIHDLPKYQQFLKALRQEASTANIVGVEGV